MMLRKELLLLRLQHMRLILQRVLPGAMDWDYKMENGKKEVLDWEAMFDVAIDPEKARDLQSIMRSRKRKIHVLCAVISVL